MKHIDLAGQVLSAGLRLFKGDVEDVLSWLDAHPDQVPGRTITESEAEDLYWVSRQGGKEDWLPALTARGLTIIPDPEPTPRQRLEALIFKEWGDADDAQHITDAIVAEFDLGVKTPEGDEGTDRGRAWWIENANVNDAEDCEACVDDLCPVHHGIALGIEFVTKKIAALGDDPELFNSIPNPPKAEGGDE